MNCEGCSKRLDPAKDRYIKLIDYPAEDSVSAGTATVDIACCDWDCAWGVATAKMVEEQDGRSTDETT